MSNLYVATAANRYFYQNLAVRADTRRGAYDKFLAYLSTPESQSLEAEELGYAHMMADQIGEKGVTLDPESYVYRVDYQGVEILEDDEIPGYRGDIGENVVMTKSGGHG